MYIMSINHGYTKKWYGYEWFRLNPNLNPKIEYGISLKMQLYGK